jgi:hypothetical protein
MEGTVPQATTGAAHLISPFGRSAPASGEGRLFGSAQQTGYGVGGRP